jgi:hypothetical protein
MNCLRQSEPFSGRRRSIVAAQFVNTLVDGEIQLEGLFKGQQKSQSRLFADNSRGP